MQFRRIVTTDEPAVGGVEFLEAQLRIEQGDGVIRAIDDFTVHREFDLGALALADFISELAVGRLQLQRGELDACDRIEDVAQQKYGHAIEQGAVIAGAAHGLSMGLRVIFPDLTAERRQQIVKIAKAKFEDSRVAVRAVRDDAMKGIDSALKAGDISEDDKHTLREKVQKVVDLTNRTLEAVFEKKEIEISK